MINRTFNWIVTTYYEETNVKSAFLINDRTEKEAQNEAETDDDIKLTENWTMVKVDDEVERFINEFGQTQAEIKSINRFKGDSSAVSEMAINFGYVWVDKFKKWINKNNSNYDIRDEVIIDYIREKY